MPSLPGAVARLREPRTLLASSQLHGHRADAGVHVPPAVAGGALHPLSAVVTGLGALLVPAPLRDRLGLLRGTPGYSRVRCGLK